VREVDRKKAHRDGLTPDPARDLGGDLLDLAGYVSIDYRVWAMRIDDFPMRADMGIRRPPGDTLPQRRACAYPGSPYLTEETR
jgi:hypothetical protein